MALSDRSWAVLLFLACECLALGPPASAERPKPPPARPRPVLALQELHLRAPKTPAKAAVDKLVRIAHPRGWTGDGEVEARAIRLYGPEGEGEIVIVVALDPSELGRHLTRLKNDHPAAQPSPPMAMTVPGFDPVKGERATRFVITGREVGEMVLLERDGVIVLIATIVMPDAWSSLSEVMERCYPTVEVIDVGSKAGEPPIRR